MGRAARTGDPLVVKLKHLSPQCIQRSTNVVHSRRRVACSVGGSSTEPFRQVGIYTGRVLKGEKPAELPIQQSSKVELIINLKIAKALGLIIPTPIIERADEVIK
jgi:ABC-type uncharacterized transport system substrate-binding protein